MLTMSQITKGSVITFASAEDRESFKKLWAVNSNMVDEAEASGETQWTVWDNTSYGLSAGCLHVTELELRFFKLVEKKKEPEVVKPAFGLFWATKGEEGEYHYVKAYNPHNKVCLTNLPHESSIAGFITPKSSSQLAEVFLNFTHFSVTEREVKSDFHDVLGLSLYLINLKTLQVYRVEDYKFEEKATWQSLGLSEGDLIEVISTHPDEAIFKGQICVVVDVACEGYGDMMPFRLRDVRTGYSTWVEFDGLEVRKLEL